MVDILQVLYLWRCSSYTCVCGGHPPSVLPMEVFILYMCLWWTSSKCSTYGGVHLIHVFVVDILQVFYLWRCSSYTCVQADMFYCTCILFWEINIKTRFWFIPNVHEEIKWIAFFFANQVNFWLSIYSIHKPAYFLEQKILGDQACFHKQSSLLRWTTVRKMFKLIFLNPFTLKKVLPATVILLIII